jgi:hypothetical protein
MDPRMKKLIVIPALFLAACATQPKPCTAEWVDWKTQRFFDEFVGDHRQDIVELRGLTANLNTEDKSLGNIAVLASAAGKAISLGSDFLNDTVPEINSAISQCGTTPKATQLFASLLRREGFDERSVKAVESLGALLDRST